MSMISKSAGSVGSSTMHYKQAGGHKQLGRGLSALIGEVSVPTVGTGATEQVLPIETICPGSFQPRRDFSEEALADLAESIRTKGILQPILVRPINQKLRPESDDSSDSSASYELIAGERRWRAAQLAQQHEIPVVIRLVSDSEALELALVENLQREDLNVVEEAEGLARLAAEFGHTQEQLGKQLGKSRPYIANMLRLLNLPETIKQKLRQGHLTAGHARPLIGLENAETLANIVVEQNLAVRDVEKLVQESKKNQRKKPEAKRDVSSGSLPRDTDIIALERDLTYRLGLKTSVQDHGEGCGVISFTFTSFMQLDGLLERLS